MKQNPVRSLSRPSIVGFAKHQALTTRQQRHRHEFVRHSWKVKKAFQPEKVWKFSDEVVAEAFLPLHHRTLLVLLLLHLLPSKHRHRHRRLVLRRAVLEIVGRATQISQLVVTNISTGCYKYLNWLFLCYQISQLVVLLPRGEVWDHYARPRHRRAAAGGELTHKATWLRDRWPRRSALRELCCGGTERWLKLFLISRTKNRMIIFWMIQALMRYFWWRIVSPGRQQ